MREPFGAHRFALSGLRCEVDTSTQGGAALCPGLTCSGPFGAELRSGRRLCRQETSADERQGHGANIYVDGQLFNYIVSPL